MSACPRCNAPLVLSDARWLPAPDGYLPALQWEHRRPDDGRWCRSHSGPPRPYQSPCAHGTVCPDSEPLRVPAEVPGIAAD